MCVYTWNRWSCGHCTKTSIEYCGVACHLLPAQRDLKIDCHIPSTSADLNEHFGVPCLGCSDGIGPSPNAFKLRYIELHPKTRDDYDARSHAKIERLREAEHLGRMAWNTFYDAASDGISKLTQALFEAEDYYRWLGASYYTRAWFTLSLVAPCYAESYELISSAFHGTYRNRTFLRP
jgi:hypothetical protein